MTDNDSRTVHFLLTGTTVPSADFIAGGRVMYAGETITLTPEQVEATRDRFGATWLDLTPEQQIERYGVQRWADGPAPEGMPIGADDTSLRYRLYTAARERAKQFSHPDERAAELAAVSKEFADVIRSNAGSNVIATIPARNGL